MPTTVYDVNLRYTADDRASRGLRGIASQADRTSKALGGIKTLLFGIGSSVALLTGKRLLIDYNSELEQMKLSMATIGTMQMKKPFEEARAEANKLIRDFEKMAAEAPLASTKDFAEMATDIAPAIAMAGGGFQKLKSMAAGAVAAAAATRTRADVAALDIQQMLMGTVTVRDRMARQLLSSRGMDHIDFNKKSAKERAEITESLLNDPALKRLASEAGNTFMGQVAGLKDRLQIALGRVGLPLMKAIGAEFEKINNWIKTHPVQLQNIINKLSEGLSSGFRFVKGVVGTLVAHKDTLLTLAKAFIVFKGIKFGVGAITGMAQGIGGAAAGMMNSFGVAGGASATLATRLATAAGLVGTFGAALAAATQAYFSWRMDQVTKQQDRQAHFGGFASDIADMRARERRKFGSGRFGEGASSFLAAARRTLQSGRETGVISADGRINEGRLAQAAQATFKGIGQDQFAKHVIAMREQVANALEAERVGAIRTFKTLQESAEVAAASIKATGRAFFESIGGGGFLDMVLGTGQNNEEWRNLAPDRGDLNVTIHKIEIASEDPDRFVFGLTHAFERAEKARTQARDVIAGGF